MEEETIPTEPLVEEKEQTEALVEERKQTEQLKNIIKSKETDYEALLTRANQLEALWSRYVSANDVDRGYKFLVNIYTGIYITVLWFSRLRQTPPKKPLAFLCSRKKKGCG